VRFANERAFIEVYNGEVWHVQRDNWSEGVQAHTQQHVAERGLDILTRDKVIVNAGTIGHLYTGTSLLLQSEAGARIRCEEEKPAFDVTCLKCGWVHRAYTRAQALQEVNMYNDWLEAQPDSVKATQSGPATIESYEGCDRCGGTAFRAANEGDAPVGCTLAPVIVNGLL
jgi:transcription elongation factor Elf1